MTIVHPLGHPRRNGQFLQAFSPAAMDLSVLLAVAIALAIFFWWRQRHKGGRSRSKAASFAGRSGGSVAAGTRRQLLRLVGGSRPTAERLISQARQRYPGKSEQWYWEKAIYDIQRDRRS
jgi:hypothetical protein